MVLGWKLHPRVEGWGAGLLSAGSLGSQRAATVPCPTAGLSRVLSGKAMESWAAPQGETRDVCTREGPGHGGVTPRHHVFLACEEPPELGLHRHLFPRTLPRGFR